MMARDAASYSSSEGLLRRFLQNVAKRVSAFVLVQTSPQTMGLLTILRKARQKEKEMRILVLCAISTLLLIFRNEPLTSRPIFSRVSFKEA